jgi:hypothetical protein
MANAYAIVASQSETDATIDYVLNSDNFTLVPVATDIPNPLWVNDGSNTSPDVNGETRFLTQTPNPQWQDDGLGTTPDSNGETEFITASPANWNTARVFTDGEFSASNVRIQAADVQIRHPELAVKIHRVTVTIVPD